MLTLTKVVARIQYYWIFRSNLSFSLLFLPHSSLAWRREILAQFPMYYNVISCQKFLLLRGRDQKCSNIHLFTLWPVWQTHYLQSCRYASSFWGPLTVTLEKVMTTDDTHKNKRQNSSAPSGFLRHLLNSSHLSFLLGTHHCHFLSNPWKGFLSFF